MSEVRRCNCDDSQCKTSDHRKHVHVNDECFHPNDIHHKIKINFIKNHNTANKNVLRIRQLNWNI